MTDWLGLPAARLGSRRADRQPDRLDPRVHAHPVRRLGRVLRLRPGPLPASRQSGGELRGRQVARARAISRSAWPWSKRSSCSDSRSRCGRRGSTTFPPANEALVVQVTGEQFAWNVHYPGPDGVFGRTDIKLLDLQSNPLGLDRADPAAKDDVTTLNQLYLPVNKPIIVQAQEQGRHPQLRRARVPREAGRHPRPHDPHLVRPHRHDRGDADPDGNPEFQYEIACAQLCGLGHYRMRGFVTVQSAEEFQKWLDEQAQPRSRPSPATSGSSGRRDALVTPGGSRSALRRRTSSASASARGSARAPRR